MPGPTEIRFHRLSRVLEVAFQDGRRYQMPCEYLRVFSPSAEVQGHGGGEPALVSGKKEVTIVRIEPIGHYAIRLDFSDGHNTGLYSWQVLEDLGENQSANWTRYLQRMEQTGLSRDPKVVQPLSALLQKK